MYWLRLLSGRRSRRRGLRGYAVAAGDGAHRDGDAVPAVDGGDRQGQGHDLLLAELLTDALEDLVRDVVGRDQGQRIGPLERGAFAVGVVGALAPGRQAVEA